MAFISSSKNNSGNEDSNIACVSTASTTFPSGSVNVATISQDTASAYIASQIKFEDINQIDEDDMEEMDIKWSMALLSMRADKFWKRTGKKINIQGSDVAGFDKSKVECFNCHKMGHFARECRAPRSQERGRKESYRQGYKTKEKTPKALMAIDGVGWDWSSMENEEEDHALVADGETPTEFVLIANTKNKVFDNSLCSNDSGSESRPPMLNKENYVPWSSRLLQYAKSTPNGKLIHNSILNGPYARRMFPEPGNANRDVNVNETFHEKTDDELSEKELKQIEADDQAI
nr:hypothetical protein [Tanacetum cinerariifolium]